MVVISYEFTNDTNCTFIIQFVLRCEITVTIRYNPITINILNVNLFYITFNHSYGGFVRKVRFYKAF